MLAVAVVREGIILSMSRLQKIDCRRLLTLANWLVLRTILQEFSIALKAPNMETIPITVFFLFKNVAWLEIIYTICCVNHIYNSNINRS